MFSKCIECETPGQNCVPNLTLLTFPQLVSFAKKRQKFLGWSNQTLADKCNLPLGTIGRVLAGEDDCKYSTMRSIILALFGGYAADFQCPKEREQEVERLGILEAQSAELIAQNTELAAKNSELLERLDKADELHRADVRGVRDAYKEQIDFLKNEVEFLRNDILAWQRRG